MRRATPLLAVCLLALPAAAQTIPAWGRVTLFAQGLQSTRDDGRRSTFTELSASISLHSGTDADGGFEYAVDARGATYPSTDRDQRLSLYDAYVGARLTGGLGLVRVRAGQMWLNDLGALGSVGGLHLEVSPERNDKLGRFRFGVFGGLEPKAFETGYTEDVRKGGVYAALDGERGRKHVVGWVLLRHSGLTERSVVTVTNFVPFSKKLFVYQAAEVDVTGPAGQGSGGLSYLFANARAAVHPKVELLATFHRGRSVDARTITLDQLAGRPVDARALEGYLFESAGGRVTVEPFPRLRVYAGYARDRTNREEASSGRITLGLHAGNLLGSGFDVTLSDNRTDRGGGSYDAWYASLGRSLGPRLYVSADYSTSLSVFRVTDQGGLIVERRPRTRRYGLSGVANVSRHFSLLLTAEQLRDDQTREERGLLGITYRY